MTDDPEETCAVCAEPAAEGKGLCPACGDDRGPDEEAPLSALPDAPRPEPA
jgi:hypothetical protein